VALATLNALEADIPAGKLVHAILDNYAAHKTPQVRRWLARHPRWIFHFTPTSFLSLYRFDLERPTELRYLTFVLHREGSSR
jgi:hypothetical protein